MKRNLSLALILVILIIGYGFFRSAPKTEEFQPPEAYRISEWSQDSVDRLVFKDAEHESVFAKTAGQWLVNGYRIDQRQLKQLLTGLEEATIVSRVSTNPENHLRFEIDDTATLVEIYSGDNRIQEMYIGKSAGGTAVYTRIPGQDAVYVLEGFTPFLLAPDEDLWRDRQIVTITPSQIDRIVYDVNDTYTVQKNGEEWSLSQRRSTVEAGLSEITSWIDELSRISATDFLGEEESTARSLGTLTLSQGSGQNLVQEEVFTIYRSNEVDRYFVKDQQGNAYLILKSSLDAVFPSFNELSERLQSSETAE